MTSRQLGLERALLVLFVVSGFAGLIYQSIWSHYLGLTLGHAAYAQTLVLAIFMGGMALGAWLVSRRGGQWRRLIFVYAVVEIAIGLAGLGFHPLFLAYTSLSQDTVYPLLDAGAAIRAWQWGGAALLIAPQSVLLGMTFPLMSGGYLRVAPNADGEILGGLYFTNSIGAALGALCSTFVLLPWVGMPGTVAIAGVLNMAVGFAAWRISRRSDVGVPAESVAAPANGAVTSPTAAVTDASLQRMILAAAAITGASSFVYEIGWVRMLNLALGTTVHSFELMLAAFILGLAFGGLWVRRRSRAITDAVRYAGYAQVWMGIAALLSLPVFAQSFRWVGALMQAVPRTDDGYMLFSLGSAGIALLVMFPAAFFAGMTLPLFTVALLRRGGGEAAIGRVYAANTLGAIVGVMLAVHVLVPILGLHLAVTLAAVADLVLGFVLLRRFAGGFDLRPYLALLLASAGVLGFSMVAGRTSPEVLASGVFRTGQDRLLGVDQVAFLRDGKTATVAVYRLGEFAAISTNGKPDAALSLAPEGESSDDEITMTMAAALPLGLHPDPKRIAVIGWGSGLTTHTLLGSPVPEVVDSIEIERAMYDGARLFGARVARAYDDPRSHVHIDDARTYFSSGRRRYDVIVSEPSNPWVSGVASLFTRQFYRFLDVHLADDGVLVQWLQAYELNDPLLATMLSALTAQFPYVDAYLTNSGDILFVASRSPLPEFRYPADAGSPLARELARTGLVNAGDVRARRLGSREMLQTLVRLSAAPEHDDFHPTVSLQAPRARFKREAASRLLNLLGLGLPVLEMTDGRRPVAIADIGTLGNRVGAMEIRSDALQARDVLLDNPVQARRSSVQAMQDNVRSLPRRSSGPIAEAELSGWLKATAEAAELTLGQFPADDLAGVWIEPVWIDTTRQPEPVRAVMAAYAAAAARDPAAMRRLGLAALAQLGEDAPLLLREHMLVMAILGALAEGDESGALAIERTQGRSVNSGSGSDARYGSARAYLLAWGDRPIAEDIRK